MSKNCFTNKGSAYLYMKNKQSKLIKRRYSFLYQHISGGFVMKESCCLKS